jgi:phage shock protein PspC (stress-responsive transcriptional regulator)
LNIERSKSDRWIRGVCGGIAHAYGWDSTVVRVIAVVLTIIIPGLSTVLALAVYLVLSFVLPESEEF